MSLLFDQIEHILRQTLDAKIGIIVRFDFTGDKTQSLYQVSRMIYRVRNELNLPPIQIRASPDNPDNEMWLFKMDDPLVAEQSKKPTKTIEVGEIF